LGAPGETQATIEQTLQAVRRLSPTSVTYSFGLRIFPQTGLVELLRKQGAHIADDDLLEPRFYLSPCVMTGMEEMVLDHARREPNWLAPQQRDSAIAKAVMRIGARLGLPGPSWRYSAAAAPIKRIAVAIRTWRAKHPRMVTGSGTTQGVT
jgi:hypothetical protein